MALRIGCSAILGLLLATTATAQTRPWQGTNPPARPPARPNQPVVPQNPTLRPRVPGQPATQRLPARARPVQQHPPIPFRLTPQQEAHLDRVLNVWQQHSSKVKTFSCEFTRWEYDPVFGPPDAPRFTDEGEIKYKTLDKGMFRVLKTANKNGKMVEIEPERAEHWICDGKSVFLYDHKTKTLREYKLPPEMQGKAIADGPLPFLFGADSAKLKQRYYMRVMEPPRGVTDQIWLEAYPRWQQDAANFKRVELILTVKDMMPSGMQTYAPNGKNRTAYKFGKLKVNDHSLWIVMDPFRASTPLGWKKVVEQTPAQQTTRRPGVPGRR